MKVSIIGYIPLILADPRSRRQAIPGGSAASTSVKTFAFSTLADATANGTTKDQANTTAKAAINPSNIIQDIQSAAQYYNISNDVLNHGCHCQGLQKLPAFGVPVDHKDFICRSWSSVRSCTFLKEGPCDGVVESSYDVSNGCGALNGCLKFLCVIDQSFQAMIRDEHSTSITEAFCERHQTVPKDSCCGSLKSLVTLNFQKFNSKEHYCKEGELMPLEAKGSVNGDMSAATTTTTATTTAPTTTKPDLPNFIKKGVNDGKWYITSIGHYIHVGERRCSLDESYYDYDGMDMDCQGYCQGLGVGSKFAVPKSSKEYESYYQTLLDNTTGYLEIGYGLLGNDLMAWNDMKFCSYQPFTSEVGMSVNLGSVIRDDFFPVWDQTKCAIKMKTSEQFLPICVYDP